MLGKCKLCLQEAELKNSHIVPEFMYTGLYDEKHRALKITRDEKKTIQKGLREHLLCQRCESQFSKYENYIKKFLVDLFSTSVSPTDQFVQKVGINYSYFKLFQMSLLWRSSISSLLAFQQVSLGPHEEKIRQMLLKEDPGLSTKYFSILFYIPNTELLHKIMRSPVKIQGKFHGFTTYEFAMGGLSWMFFVGGYKIPEGIQEFILSEIGEMKIFIPSQTNEQRELLKISKSIKDYLS